MNTRITFVLLGLIVVVAVLAALFLHPQTTKAPSPLASVDYACNSGKTIHAVYYAGDKKPAATAGEPPVPTGSVALTLSDGRSMTLPQTLSADGGRYANADESFIFWTKGNGALVLENNQEKSYIGCVLVANVPSDSGLSQVYQNGQDGFSIRLPQGYTTDASYKYQAFGPGKDIYGVKFAIPSSMATGTNLASDTYLSVEQIPEAKNCSAALFLEAAKPSEVTDGDVTYSLASSTGAAAGNRYFETVYAIPGTNPCMAVRYFIHYGVIENYPAGAVRAFDQAALLAQFDSIRRTLVINQSYVVEPPTGTNGILPYNSGIEGTVSLGPTCPVQRVPPDPACADKPYSTTVTVRYQGSDAVFATAQSDASGAFKVSLPPGSYTITAGNGSMLPRCATVNATVGPTGYVTSNISCDTGIR